MVKISGALIALERFEEANHYMDTPWPIADAQGEPRLLGESHRLCAELAEKQGDYQKALERYRTYVLVKDTLAMATQNDRIAELQSKLDLASRDAEILVMEKENEVRLAEGQQQNMFIGLLVGGLAITKTLVEKMGEKYPSAVKWVRGRSLWWNCLWEANPNTYKYTILKGRVLTSGPEWELVQWFHRTHT